MTNIPCPHPAKCQAQSHQPGSAAAAACATKGRPSPMQQTQASLGRSAPPASDGKNSDFHPDVLARIRSMPRDTVVDAESGDEDGNWSDEQLEVTYGFASREMGFSPIARTDDSETYRVADDLYVNAYGYGMARYVSVHDTEARARKFLSTHG